MRGGGRLARLRATSFAASSASFSAYSHCSSSAIHRSRREFSTKLLWYGRHHSSSFSNSTTSTPLKRRMVKKDKRRAMVEAFVEKYKAGNGGKFPNVSITKKEVGGSYYTIREIVQKLIYESSHSSSVKEMKEATTEKSSSHRHMIDNIGAAEPPLMKAEKAGTDPNVSAPPMYHSGYPKPLADDKKKPQKGGQDSLHRHDSGVLAQEKPLTNNSSIWSRLKSSVFNFWKNR